MRLTPRLDLSALVTCHTLCLPFTGSQSAVFLLNSRMGPFTAPPGIAPEDPFSRSYGAILPSSLTRFLSRALVSLYPPTCVGFGTAGGLVRVDFSRKHGRMASRRASPTLGARLPADAGDSHWPQPLSFSDPRLNPRRCRNVDLPSIDYAFRPRLRCRLTPGGRTCPGKPWDSGDGDFHPIFRYSCPHNRWLEVHRRFRARLRPVQPRSPTVAPQKGAAREFGLAFTPDHFRRGVSRVVSCYALFKWWLPLSQHPTCPGDFTALVT